MSIILVRHGKSLWNVENKFTGWEDIGLSEIGINEANECADFLCEHYKNIHFCFKSGLKRATKTADIILNKYKILNLNTIDSISNEALNERDYGNLTGMNKDDAREKYGKEQVQLWRRHYYERPPGGENLNDVVQRVGNYYDSHIKTYVKQGKNVLIVAHGNSLRALLVHLNIYNSSSIETFEIETGKPLIIYPKHYWFKARQILDSRGFPTIEVDCMKNNKLIGRGSSPSGASCGSNEAIEIRDSDKFLYKGKSVFNRVNFINENDIFKLLNINDDQTIKNIYNFDSILKSFDNTTQKSILGGNLTTALSFCVMNTGANLNNIQMYEHIYKTYGFKHTLKLPTPMVNIINGGKHAGGKLKIQEFMIVPSNELSCEDQTQLICEIYYNLKNCIKKQYGETSINVGDEGGFAPNINTPHEAIALIMFACEYSGYELGKDVFIALDCAASEFFDIKTETYEIEENLKLNSLELIDYYAKLISLYPFIISIEDPFDEKDYTAWSLFTQIFGNKIMIVGDDLFTTNPDIVKEGLQNNLANSLLLKVNQIGTISEAIQAANIMFQNNNSVIVSHRSGETNHSYLIDIAIGIGADYVKIGAPARGERISKFNRLLELSEII